MRPCRGAKGPDSGGNCVNLCGFEVGLDRPFFLIAGAHRNAEQGPRQRGVCDRVEAPRVRIQEEIA
jgi:hypothetical protein